MSAASAIKLGSLEIGRFVAASIVLLSHMSWFAGGFALNAREGIFGSWDPPGPIAVQYFFTLSGFVMVMAHHRDFGQRGAALLFWWRRACRIFPMYWLALLITLSFSSAPVGGMANMVKLLVLAPLSVQDAVLPAWSLHVEIAFYVIFGICLLPNIGRPLLALWGLLVVMICWEPALQTWLHVPSILSSNTFLYIFGTNFSFFHLQFFAGLFAGWLYLKIPLGRKAGWVLLASGTVVLLFCGPELQWGHLYFLPRLAPAIAFGFGSIILGLANLERGGAFHCGRNARWLGAMSYPLYILHISLMFVVLKLWGGSVHFEKAGLYVFCALDMLAIYVASFLIAYGIDQPLQRILQRVGRKSVTTARCSALCAK